jgi:hypothetical protein
MSHDTMIIEVQPAGAVRITTGAISPSNHMSATRFVHYFVHQLGRTLGGTTTRRRTPDAPPLPEDARRALVKALADALVADHRQTAGETR